MHITRKRIAALLIMALVTMGLYAVPAAQAQGGPATVSVTVPSTVTFTFTSATCNLGSVPAGTTAQTLNCITYDVSTNNPSGFSIKLTTPARTAFGRTLAVGTDFRIRRNGAPVYNVFDYGSLQINGAENAGAQNWREKFTAGASSYGDDLQVSIAATQAPGTFTGTLTYNATANP